jgi:hypothetical protein
MGNKAKKIIVVTAVILAALALILILFAESREKSYQKEQENKQNGIVK